MKSIIFRITIFTIIWLTLTNFDFTSLIFGSFAVGVITYISFKLYPINNNLNYTAILKFILFFLIESFKSGFEVALLALKPKLKLNPKFITYNITLKSHTSIMLFIHIISLMPGTLSAKLNSSELTLHILNYREDVLKSIEELEKKIVEIFNE